MAKEKKKQSKNKKAIKEKANIDFDFSDQFDAAEKSAKLSSIEVTENIDLQTVIHSGSLVLDLHVLGGGYQAGRVYDIQGKESGGKTTLGKMAVAQSIKSIPNHTKCIYCDAEGTLDKTWFKNILDLYNIDIPLKQIFGKRSKSGEWLHKPIVRLIKPTSGDDYLKLLIKYMNNLPDKVFHDEKWWYKWTPTEAKIAKKTGGATDKELRAMLKSKGLNHDVKMFKSTGSFMVEIPNNYGGPELLILTDSMIALVPRQTAEDDSNAMSQHGRMFGKYLNNIKGLASRKGVVMININQLREKPAQQYGDPTYAPGGNTLHYVGDCRLRVNPCANPKGKGQVEEIGNNTYRWTSINNLKNKLFTPYRKMKMRWWTQKDGVVGCGIDPVLDTLEYLEYTGQIQEVGRKGFYIVLKGGNKRTKKLEEILFTDELFKEFILTKEVISIVTSTKKKKDKIDSIKKEKPIVFNLRNFCIKQIRSGKARELYTIYEEVIDTIDTDNEDDE